MHARQRLSSARSYGSSNDAISPLQTTSRKPMCPGDELCCIGGHFGLKDVKSHDHIHHIGVSWTHPRDAVSGRAPLDVPDLARYGTVGMQGGQWCCISDSKLQQEWRIRAMGSLG